MTELNDEVQTKDDFKRDPNIYILLQPEDKNLEIPRQKTARQLLHFLGMRQETALVVRAGELLTPDRRIYPGDNILVRKVTSSG